jgi:sRNA-binding protein
MTLTNGSAAATERTVAPTTSATLLLTVAELFPVFTVERWQPHKPLAIGIDKALIATGILKPFEAGLVLRAYTRRRMYLTALAAGGHRHDLNGVPCEKISDEHRACAKATLAAMDAKAAAAAAEIRATQKATREAEKTKARAPRTVADKPEGPRPYHKATPQNPSAEAPPPVASTSPKRLGLADLKRAFQERKAAQAATEAAR